MGLVVASGVQCRSPIATNIRNNEPTMMNVNVIEVSKLILFSLNVNGHLNIYANSCVLFFSDAIKLVTFCPVRAHHFIPVSSCQR